MSRILEHLKQPTEAQETESLGKKLFDHYQALLWDDQEAAKAFVWGMSDELKEHFAGRMQEILRGG